MATTNVPGWKVRYAWVKETTFKTGAAPTVGPQDQQLLPVTSDSMKFNWSQMTAKYAGQGRPTPAGAVFNTEIAPEGDLQVDVNYMDYQGFCQAHFTGGVAAIGTIAITGSSTNLGGTMFTYGYQTGTNVAKTTSYTLWRVLATGAESDQFLGVVPEQLTWAGDNTSALKLTASLLAGDGTYAQNAGAGTVFAYPSTSTFKPYVAYNGLVTMSGMVLGTVKSWSITSKNNMSPQMALDGSRGITDFLMGEHSVSGQFVADLDTNETAKAGLFAETVGTAIITYYGYNATYYLGSTAGTVSPDLTFTVYFRATDANTPFGGGGVMEQTVPFVGVDPGVGYSLKIVGTSLSGTLHAN